MREIMSVDQPCILCEEPLMVSVLHRDDETGEECWEHAPIEHNCAALIRLSKERIKTNYAKSGTTALPVGD